MIRKPKKSIIVDNEKEKDIKNVPKLVIDNNYPLLNQFIPLIKILKKISFFLSNISRANIL